MNLGTLFVKSFATIDHGGITTPKGHSVWESDQHGPADIKRAQVLAVPYVAFGKLNLPDKLAFSVATLALRDGPAEHNKQMGLFLVIPDGSLSTDRAFRDSIEQGNPSPALFAATLPSSPVADIAIYHRLTGPNIVFAGGDSPLVAALISSTIKTTDGDCDEVLVVMVDEMAESSAAADSSLVTPPYAAALLLGIRPEKELPALSFEQNASVSIQETGRESDSRLCESLAEALKNCSSLRVPVCAGSFRGYICLESPRKDG
jgi:hypothetical protein